MHSAIQLRSWGGTLYNMGGYTRAVEKLTEALELCNVPTLRIGILEDRAAARAKVGGAVSLELAL